LIKVRVKVKELACAESLAASKFSTPEWTGSVV
jgi:hypothetical protein